MTIIKTNSLTTEQERDIALLEKAAYKKYKLGNSAFLSNDINFSRSIPCFFMGYVGERLAAFLTLFMPTKQEAEIVAFTHPDFWEKGCFGQLFDEAAVTLLKYGIKEVLFAVEPKSKNAQAVLKTLGCTDPEHSEYRMVVTSLDKAPDYSGVHFFEVDNSNKELFRAAIAAVYPDDKDMDNFYDAVVSSDTRHGYILYTDRPIGIFNIGTEQGASLYGVGISPEFRGRGYGKKLMGYAMREGLSLSDKLTLDVDSDNPVAYALYLKCGFKTEFQVDYYRYRLG